MQHTGFCITVRNAAPTAFLHHNPQRVLCFHHILHCFVIQRRHILLHKLLGNLDRIVQRLLRPFYAILKRYGVSQLLQKRGQLGFHVTLTTVTNHKTIEHRGGDCEPAFLRQNHSRLQNGVLQIAQNTTQERALDILRFFCVGVLTPLRNVVEFLVRKQGVLHLTDFHEECVHFRLFRVPHLIRVHTLEHIQLGQTVLRQKRGTVAGERRQIHMRVPVLLCHKQQ